MAPGRVMRRRSFAAIVVLLALRCVAPAAAGPAIPAVQVPFESYTLSNGLRVTLAEDRRLPLVATNFRFFTGSGDDPPGLTGLAHLVEHLYAFSAPVGYPDLQGAGALQDGATTDPDRTTYYTTLPSNQLELFMALESDVWLKFPSRLRESLLNRERVNVRNERRLVIENEPYGMADEEVFRQLFHAGHPYHSRYVGVHADIEAIGLEDVRRFAERHYVPANASLVIAGDIDKARTRALIERYFGRIPAGARAAPPEVGTPPITSQRRIVTTDRIELPRVAFAWITPGWYRKGNAEAELLATLLGKGASSRLQAALVRDRKLARQVVVEHLPFAHGSVLSIKATTVAGGDIGALERALHEEIEELRRTGPTEQEAEGARNAVALQLVRGLEKLGEITAFGDFTADGNYGGLAEQLNQCIHFESRPGCLPDVLKRYQEVTPAALHRAAKEMLAPSARVVLVTSPGERRVDDPPARGRDAATLVASLEDAAFEAPPKAPASTIRPLQPQSSTLANGMTVWVAERPHLPIVTAQIVVRAGGGSSPPTQTGLATLTVEMLARGTALRSAHRVAADVARLGTVLETDAGSDAAALSIRVLKGGLESAVGLLAEAIRRPIFSLQELDRARAEKLARLAQLRANPDTLASRLFTEAVYGAGAPYATSGLFNDDLFARTHRYGYDELGTEQSLQAVKREDLRRFWRERYVPGNAALILTGDVTPDEARALASRHFGDWRGRLVHTTERATAGPGAAGGMVISDTGPTSQTALRVGGLGLSRSNEDHVAVRMLNIVLGELYASRITDNLRGRNGYTYMARSQFAMRREPGPFVIGTNVKTEATAAAVRELFAEIERIRREPVSEQEIAFARNAFSSSLLTPFQTTTSLASHLGQLFTHGLAPDGLEKLERQIAATSAEDVQRAAQRYLDPDRMVVVAVGDRARIEADLRGVRAASRR
jgi:zinc protease